MRSILIGWRVLRKSSEHKRSLKNPHGRYQVNGNHPKSGCNKNNQTKRKTCTTNADFTRHQTEPDISDRSEGGANSKTLPSETISFGCLQTRSTRIAGTVEIIPPIFLRVDQYAAEPDFCVSNGSAFNASPATPAYELHQFPRCRLPPRRPSPAAPAYEPHQCIQTAIQHGILGETAQKTRFAILSLRRRIPAKR